MNENNRISMKSIMKISLRESRRGPTKTQLPSILLDASGGFGRRPVTTGDGSHVVLTVRFHESRFAWFPRLGFTSDGLVSRIHAPLQCPAQFRTVRFARFCSHGSKCKWKIANAIENRYDPLRPANTRYDPPRPATTRFDPLRFATFRFSRFASHGSNTVRYGSVLTVRFTRFGSHG